MARPFTRTSRKGKTPKTMAVNLSAWLRAYAADEQSGVEAVRRAQVGGKAAYTIEFCTQSARARERRTENPTS